MIIISKFRNKTYHPIEIFKIYQKYQKELKNRITKNHLLKHFKINNKLMKIINTKKKNRLIN